MGFTHKLCVWVNLSGVVGESLTSVSWVGMINKPLMSDSESVQPVAIVDGTTAYPAPAPHRAKAPGRRSSGTLGLYRIEDRIEEAPQARPQVPYIRFRLCRGFIDDLNHVLPIRVRIQLESEIVKGGRFGQVEGGQMRFRWEFTEA
jgi:hypothetical protein